MEYIKGTLLTKEYLHKINLQIIAVRLSCNIQLMPVYVKDANRILGEEKYSLSDRYKRDTSIEMFNVIQDHYNPTHDIAKAIKLHNPRAGRWYYNRVIKVLNS